MTYASSDPAARLASRKWRIRHSAWLLAPILGVGVLSFVGFVYVGLRVRTRKFWTALVIGCIGSAIVWVVASDSNEATDGTQTTDWRGGVTLAVWAALIVYGLLINRDYLRWRATRSEANAWYRQPVPGSLAASVHLAPAPHAVAQPPDPGVGVAPVAPPPQTPPFLGVDSSHFYAAPTVARPSDPPTASCANQAEWPREAAADARLVDANSAPAAEMVAVLRIDVALADRIVSARQVRGGFRDLDDLVTTAGLQPHELVRIRGKLSFGPVQTTLGPPMQQARPAPQHPAPSPSPAEQRTGRILDY